MMLCLMASLILRGTFASFLHQLLRRLVYLDNFFIISREQDDLLKCFNTFFSFAWIIAPKFGLPQQIPISNFLIRICKHYMLCKIFHKTLHHLCPELSNLYYPKGVTGSSSSVKFVLLPMSLPFGIPDILLQL